jgi:predicted helicase
VHPAMHATLHRAMHDAALHPAMQLRVLVSTDVLAEGTDVPSCACVVRFDPPTSYVNYVQALAPCLCMHRAATHRTMLARPPGAGSRGWADPNQGLGEP